MLADAIVLAERIRPMSLLQLPRNCSETALVIAKGVAAAAPRLWNRSAIAACVRCRLRKPWTSCCHRRAFNFERQFKVEYDTSNSLNLNRLTLNIEEYLRGGDCWKGGQGGRGCQQEGNSQHLRWRPVSAGVEHVNDIARLLRFLYTRPRCYGDRSNNFYRSTFKRLPPILAVN